MASSSNDQPAFRPPVIRLISALLAGTAAAVVGSIAVVVVYQGHPSVRLDMTRELPRTVTGLYPPERQDKAFFAWSSGKVALDVGSLDRRVPWLCRADAVNWRPSSAGPASVRVESDGRLLLERRVTEARVPLEFTVPPDPSRSGLSVGIAVSPTFVPGPQDPRELGLAFLEIRCDPAAGARPWPAIPIIARGALAAAAVGVVLGLTGLPLAASAALAMFVAAAQAFSLGIGGAVQSLARPPVYVLACLLALFCLLPVVVAGAVRRKPLSAAARLSLAVSACAFYLKLLFLLHPDKTIVDAVFHAHRLDAVLAGRLFFTQLSTSATPFPYAIGLYVFSAPWAWLTTDHVTLLRIIVCAAEACAGLVLYPTIVRAWNDRTMGVMAVALFHLLPLPYAVIGNANLTNDFGQSVALVTVAAAATWAFAPGRLLPVAGLTALAALAFLSHVGTFTVLLPTLVALAALHRVLGGPTGRAPARSIVAASALAVVLAVGLYYSHFGDVYRPHLERAKARLAIMIGPPGQAAQPPGEGTEPAGAHSRARTAPPLQLGVRGAIDQTRGAFGLPMLGLALAGTWSLVRRRRADRLVLALMAWGAVWLGFLGWSALRPVEPLYVQDAWEFIGRVELATSPAVAVLAGCGAVWAWRAGLAPRIASVALVGAAFLGGARALGAWLF